MLILNGQPCMLTNTLRVSENFRLLSCFLCGHLHFHLADRFHLFPSASAEVDNKYRALRCQVSYVEPDDYTHERIRNHVLDSQVKSHDIQVLNVYALKREVRPAFLSSK